MHTSWDDQVRIQNGKCKCFIKIPTTFPINFQLMFFFPICQKKNEKKEGGGNFGENKKKRTSSAVQLEESLLSPVFICVPPFCYRFNTISKVKTQLSTFSFHMMHYLFIFNISIDFFLSKY